MHHHPQVIEHPNQAFIALRPAPGMVQDPTHLFGSLRCHWCIPHRPGSRLLVEVEIDKVCAQACAVVINCSLDEDGYCFELGLLDAEQAFQLRMLEQLGHILQYREQIERREGRHLDREQAAREWIALYADDFPAA